MEIPGAQIPLPYISKPSIQPVRPASVPLPGTRAFDYHRYEMAQARRKQYYFDYNNTNQINSWADVMTRTFNGTHENPITGFMEDTQDLLWNGAVRPLLENANLSEMTKNLWNNTWVNVIESIDVVDNIWKGYVLGGNEGASRAFHDRVNYNYDTGNILTDIGAEMLTPTNLVTLGIGGLAKSVVKGTIQGGSKSLMKGIAKYGHLADPADMTKFIKTLSKNGHVVNGDDLALLNKLVMRKQDIAILKALRVMRTPFDIADAAGPKLTYYTTLFPTVSVIRGLNRGQQAMMKYSAAQFIRNLPEQTLISEALNITKVIDNYEEMLVDGADAMYRAGGYAERFKKLALNDMKLMEVVLRDLGRTIDEGSTIKGILSGADNPLTHAQAVEKQALDTYAKYIDGLDAFAKKASRDTLETFEEYEAVVLKIADHPSINGLGRIKKKLAQARKLKRVAVDYLEAAAKRETINRALMPLRDTLKAMVDDRVTIRDTIEASRETVGTYVEQLNALDRAIAAYNKAEAHALEVKIKELELQQGKLTADITAVRKSISQLETVLAKENAELADLRAKTKTRVFTEKQRTYMRALSERVRRAEARLVELNKRLDSLEATVVEDIPTGRVIDVEDTIALEIERESLRLQEIPPEAAIAFKVVAKHLDAMRENIKVFADTLDEIVPEDVTHALKARHHLYQVYKSIPKTAFAIYDMTDEKIKHLYDRVMVAIDDMLTAYELPKLEGGPINVIQLSSSLTRTVEKGVKSFRKHITKVTGSTNLLQGLIDQKLVKKTNYTERWVNDHDMTKVLPDYMDGLDDTAAFAEALRLYKDAGNSDLFPEIVDEALAMATTLAERVENLRLHLGSADAETMAAMLDAGLDEAGLLLRTLDTVKTFLAKEGVKRSNVAADRNWVPDPEYPNTAHLALKPGDEGYVTPLPGYRVARLNVALPDELLTTVDNLQHTLTNFLSLKQATLVHTPKRASAKEYKLMVPGIQRMVAILDDPTVAKFIESVSNMDIDPAISLIHGVAKFNTSKLVAARALIDGGDMMAAVKMLQEEIGAVMDVSHLTDPVALANKITETATLIDDAKRVMGVLEGMYSTSELINELDALAPELGGYDIAAAIFDALQAYSNRNAHELISDPGQMVFMRKGIVERVNLHLRNQSGYSPKLSNMIAYIKSTAGKDLPEEAYTEYERLFGNADNASHTAIADAYANALVDKYILQVQNDETFKIIYGDFESSGLNLQGSQMHQASLVDVSSDVHTLTLYINHNIDPRNQASDSLLYTLFDDPKNPKHAIEDLRALYAKVHREPNGTAAAEALREHFKFPGEIRIVPCDGEYDLLKAYMDGMDALHPATGKLKLGFYNGLDYDLPLFLNRLSSYGINAPKYFTKSNIHDSLVLLEDKYGVRTLSAEQTTLVEKIIDDFVDGKAAEMFNGALDTTTLEVRINRIPQRLLPSIDTSFKDALSRLQTYFNPQAVSMRNNNRDLINAQKVMDGLGLSNAVLKPFTDFSAAMRDVVDDLVRDGDALGDYIIDMSRVDEILKADALSDIPMDLRQTTNIMALLQRAAESLGLAMPSVMVKTTQNDALIADWFNVLGKERSLHFLENSFAAAKDMNMTLSKIKQPELAARVTPAQYLAVKELLIERISAFKAFRSSDDLMHDLYLAENDMQNFAVVLWLYQRHIEWANIQGVGVLQNELLRADIRNIGGEELIKILDRPNETIFKYYSGLDDHFFSINKDTTSRDVLKYFDATINQSHSLMALSEIREQLVPSTRMKVLLPLYRRIYKPFVDIPAQLEQALEAHNALASTAEPLKMENAFRQLRPMYESVDNFIAFNKLGQVLGQTPEEMLAYLYYKAKGTLTFKLSDLMSDNYAVMRNGSRVKDVIKGELYELFIKYINDKEMYEKLGMHITERSDGRVIFSLNPDRMAEFSSLAYPKSLSDYDFTEYVEKYMEQDEFIKMLGLQSMVRESMKDYAEGRAHLLRINQSAMSSTLEKLDDVVLDNILYALGDFPHATSDVFTRMGAFDNEVFNHSVLGHIDSRRELMQFATFNPIKGLFNASEIMHGEVATQVRYVEMLFDSTYKLSTMIDQAPGEVSNQDVFDYLQSNKHLKVAFLNEDKRLGYKISAITIYSPKDVDFALSVGAIILDTNTYIKSVEVINKHIIPRGLVRLFERAVLAPFKLGYLAYNYAAAFRNVFDSSLKNIQSTGDVSIIPYMFETAKNYMNYRSVVNQLLEKAERTNRPLPRVIEDYFKQTDTQITRPVFDSFNELRRSGSSSGMVQEFQEFYGDTISKVFRRLPRGTGMTEPQFRELVSMPDDVAEALLRKSYKPEHINLIMYHKTNLLHFKRGYAMNQKYMGQDLNVDDFTKTLMQPTRITMYTPEQQAIILDLMEDTKNISVESDMLEKLMTQPFLAKSMDMHGSVEEIMRASLYQWLRDQGYTQAKATAQVTKTHFDYAHKPWLMRYFDMAVPFSFFRINNVLYWAEELGKSNTGMEFLAKYAGVTANLEDTDIDDIMMRRGLQYQILAGNPVINRETGTTLKLNPSMLDALKALTMPLGYVAEGTHSAYQAALTLGSIEPYEGEPLDAYAVRKNKVIAQLIPLIGPQWQRTMSKDMDPVSGLFLGPIFNTTWTPEQRKRKSLLKGKYKYKYTPRAGQTFKRFSYFSGKSAFNKVYYGSMYRMNYGVPRATKLVRSAETRHKQLWGKAISKSGRSKHQLLLFPTNKYTLKMKVMLLRQMANSYR